ncbi:hypothetical protein [uncultured Pseudoteredinibacter sp.]|uniref:hypothetical protein n=1 Tax=uncultured Pseudoteredinibacter sp. TaxID=1641701 RepID=UPI00262CAAA2|nr:hypothetical protein [uncultured Pseudoteredinibacter sp.]
MKRVSEGDVEAYIKKSKESQAKQELVYRSELEIRARARLGELRVSYDNEGPAVAYLIKEFGSANAYIEGLVGWNKNGNGLLKRLKHLAQEQKSTTMYFHVRSETKKERVAMKRASSCSHLPEEIADYIGSQFDSGWSLFKYRSLGD